MRTSTEASLMDAQVGRAIFFSIDERIMDVCSGVYRFTCSPVF
jgi:hypothetical protein